MRRILPALLLLASLPAFGAEPYQPASGATVLLQRTPGAAKALRAARPRGDDSAQAIAAAAAAAIERARITGDVRHYGQAQALLGAWWTAADPPPALRVLRATLRQQRHDFAGALADLDAVLTDDPRNAQARLVRATIRLVQGEPQQARGDCAALIGEASLLVTATCIGAVGGLTGQGATALAAIEQSLARDADAPAAIRLWSLTQAAEIAERLGQRERAAAHYTTALALAAASGVNDVYLKAAQADFLLDQSRTDTVREQLAAATDFDPLLLRLALAEAALGQAGDAAAASRAQGHFAELRARFALAAQRGEAPHTREQAMASQHLGEPGALGLAQRNWQTQREPADARLLLAAALAARDKAAAKPVLDWLDTTRLEDVRLAALRQEIEALP